MNMDLLRKALITAVGARRKSYFGLTDPRTEEFDGFVVSDVLALLDELGLSIGPPAPPTPPTPPEPPARAQDSSTTLRDYFAGQAMAGRDPRDGRPEAVAQHAYAIADAMLAARDGG